MDGGQSERFELGGHTTERTIVAQPVSPNNTSDREQIRASFPSDVRHCTGLIFNRTAVRAGTSMDVGNSLVP